MSRLVNDIFYLYIRLTFFSIARFSASAEFPHPPVEKQRRVVIIVLTDNDYFARRKIVTEQNERFELL